MRSERYYILVGARLALSLAQHGHSLTPEIAEQILVEVNDKAEQLYPEITPITLEEGDKVITLAKGGEH